MNTGEIDSIDVRRETLLARLSLMQNAQRQIEEELARLDGQQHPAHKKPPRLRLIKGGAVVAVPLIWLQNHAAPTVAAAIIGVISGTGGLVAGQLITPPPAEAEAVIQPHTSSVQAPRPVFIPPPVVNRPGAVPSPSATPLPTGAPGPAPALSDAMPNPTPLLEPASLDEYEPGLAPLTPSPTLTPTPTPTPTATVEWTRKTATLHCVGEPGGEPPEDVSACVDGLLGD